MENYLRDERYDKCRQFISDKQHGFLPQKSCTTQLISVLGTTSQSLDNRNDVDVICFDFAKAFDSVNHDLILYKLKYKFNIDGLMLMIILLEKVAPVPLFTDNFQRIFSIRRYHSWCENLT